MARVSRRINNTILLNENVYRTGIYVRLSNERTESWRNKSQSIESQIFYCKEYARLSILFKYADIHSWIICYVFGNSFILCFSSMVVYALGIGGIIRLS